MFKNYAIFYTDPLPISSINDNRDNYTNQIIIQLLALQVERIIKKV